MKKLILKSIVALGLVSLFSGCMSEDEKKAKQIAVENILKKDTIEKAYKLATGKTIPNNEFSMINGDRKKLNWIRDNYEIVKNSKNDSWINDMNNYLNKNKSVDKIDYSNAFGK
jgi:hypothetical protein